MTFYNITADDAIKQLESDPSKGLSHQEAAKRLEENGENRLAGKKKKSTLSRFLEQFKDVMIIILIIAAIISFFTAKHEGGGAGYFEPLLIILIVVLNAIMGMIQESKAEKALEALEQLSVSQVRVIRDDVESKIDSANLVVGDIILIEAGDKVSADARLIRSASLKSEESALTGESVPTDKYAESIVDENAPLGDRINMIYSGCNITYGRATAIVTATGMNTEMGKIANLLNNANETQTPLQQKLSKLGKQLGILALIACAIIFVIGLFNNIPIMEIFMTSVSLAVSAIPEGLPAIITVVLSIGVQRMASRNAIIKKLPAVETLGSASVICSDKTGTLTQNKMTLTKAYVEDCLEDISENNSENIKKMLEYATLCCDGAVKFENGKDEHFGDPTETAIIVGAYKNGIKKESLESQYPRVAELPFDSDRKLMTTVHKYDDKFLVIVKGAFDVIAKKCISGNIEGATSVVQEMSEDALRVLAVAYKWSNEPVAEEDNLTFMGLVGMIDPPRPEAKAAVSVCREAGMKPVMITGDHVLTASAIARELGILTDNDMAITGAELGQMSKDELAEKVHNISVYARVSPQDKIRIVEAWQEQGEIVSMTGDGVNDAPALKAADIGCAMGITGTDVSKGAADMILTDDNFATIVEAVKEGRGIYDNMKKVVGFLLSTNIGEVFTVFFAMLIWHQSPLLSMQLLWINLVTDSLPAIALGMEKTDENIMKNPPIRRDESIFAHGLGWKIVIQAILFAVLTLIGFSVGMRELGTVEAGRTVAFTVLSLSQITHAFNMRSHKSLFSIGAFSNKYLNGAALTSLLATLLVIFIPPVSNAFGLAKLTTPIYICAFLLSLSPIIIIEIVKKMSK